LASKNVKIFRLRRAKYQRFEQFLPQKLKIRQIFSPAARKVPTVWAILVFTSTKNFRLRRANYIHM
jgi:hypothetical protein